MENAEVSFIVRDHSASIFEARLETLRHIGKVLNETYGVGTDGAHGLPCPNLGTGGYAFHGPYEHITAEGMDTVVEVLLGIVGRYAK